MTLARVVFKVKVIDVKGCSVSLGLSSHLRPYYYVFIVIRHQLYASATRRAAWLGRVLRESGARGLIGKA